MRRPTTSSTAIPPSAFRSPAIPIPFARSGNRCAWPVPLREPCWCRPRPANGRSIRRACSASNGKVTHSASGRVAAYGDLVDAASSVPVPQNPPLKDPKDFTLIGKPLKRLDTPNKTDGKVVYGIDALLPGMKFATLGAVPGVRRQGRPCRRQRGESRSRRTTDRRAGRSGRGRRRSHLGGQDKASTR